MTDKPGALPDVLASLLDLCADGVRSADLKTADVLSYNSRLHLSRVTESVRPTARSPALIRATLDAIDDLATAISLGRYAEPPHGPGSAVARQGAERALEELRRELAGATLRPAARSADALRPEQLKAENDG